MPHTPLVDDLLSWDRTLQGALSLRDRVQAAEAPPQQRSPAIGHRALAQVVVWFERPPTADALNKWVLKPRNADEARLLAPLLGDERLGHWPARPPTESSDADAVLWLEVLKRVQPWVTDEALVQLGRLLAVRSRQVWRPAAEALAELSTVFPHVAQWVAAHWAHCAPSGLPPRWPKARSLFDPEASHTEAAHEGRHALYLAACVHRAGGHLDGFTPARFAALGLPRDDADRSVVLVSLAACVPSSAADGLLGVVASHAPKLTGGPLAEAAARELCDALTDTPAEAAWLEALTTPRWLDHGVPADGLWAWVCTHRWLQERGSTEAAERLIEQAGIAVTVLQPLREDGDLQIDRAVERVHQLTTPTWVALHTKTRVAITLCEARRLLEGPALAAHPWVDVLRAAGSDGSALPGSCGEVAACNLAVALAQQGLTVQTFLREATLPEAAVLQLAPLGHGFVATQVALQVERLLRESPSDADRVRLLWRVLQADPPKQTFQQLLRMLRAAEGTPLRQVVSAVSALDRCRDEGRPPPELASAFRNLLDTAWELLDDEGCQAISELSALADELRERGEPLDPVDPRWALRLQRIVLGDHGRGGVLHWVRWLHDDAHSDSISVAFSRLASALASVRQTEPGVGLELAAEVRAASSALGESLGGMGWPEATLLQTLLEQARSRGDQAALLGRRSAAEARRLASLLERADEEAIVATLADADTLALLPTTTIRAMHSFLLSHQRFADAKALALAAQERVSLPSPRTWLLPLFAAVAGGTFLVLDVGEDWLKLARDGFWILSAGSIGLALSASFALLAGNLSQRMATPGLGWGARWRRIARRVAPTYLSALVLSLGVSAIAMASLGRFVGVQSLMEWAMWSSLSLFLGMFLGLVVQGQRLTSGS